MAPEWKAKGWSAAGKEAGWPAGAPGQAWVAEDRVTDPWMAPGEAEDRVTGPWRAPGREAKGWSAAGKEAGWPAGASGQAWMAVDRMTDPWLASEVSVWPLQGAVKGVSRECFLEHR